MRMEHEKMIILTRILASITIIHTTLTLISSLSSSSSFLSLPSSSQSVFQEKALQYNWHDWSDVFFLSKWRFSSHTYRHTDSALASFIDHHHDPHHRGLSRRRVCNTINTAGLTGKTLHRVVSKARIGGWPVKKRMMIYILWWSVCVCLCVCHKKSSLPPGSLL